MALKAAYETPAGPREVLGVASHEVVCLQAFDCAAGRDQEVVLCHRHRSTTCPGLVGSCPPEALDSTRAPE